MKYHLGQIDISKLCAKYQISQTQYYKWRDQLLKFGYQAFEAKNITKKEEHLEQELIKLKKNIGYSLGLWSKANDWFKALEDATNKRFPCRIKDTDKDQTTDASLLLKDL